MFHDTALFANFNNILKHIHIGHKKHIKHEFKTSGNFFFLSQDAEMEEQTREKLPFLPSLLTLCGYSSRGKDAPLPLD